MRVFAGPNGSGKSTIIKSIRNYKVNGRPIDFGVYVNADEIANLLRKGNMSFSRYQISLSQEEFQKIAAASGLVGENRYPENRLKTACRIKDNTIELLRKPDDEALAQITAHVIREKLLSEKKKFSFETVFSHESKVDIMRRARQAGYKVYFYFVSTKSPEINKYRVQVRVKRGGHDVPEDRIKDRYYRAMNLMYQASQEAYQAFYFDNSENGKDKQSMFAHFKLDKDGNKVWDDVNEDVVPNWFRKYYREHKRN